MRVAAPPVRGKANRELVAYLSRLLEVERGIITIARGSASRNKVLAITGLSRDEVLKRLLP